MQGNRELRIKARAWSEEILNNPRCYCLIDCETTSLQHPEILEIAAIDGNGWPLLNTRVQSQNPPSSEAVAVHGITHEDVKDCDTWVEVSKTFEEVINIKTLVAFNWQFERRAIIMSYQHWNMRAPVMKGECCMKIYAGWYGQWSEKHQDYAYQKLRGDHSALGDCLQMLELIKTMANTEI